MNISNFQKLDPESFDGEHIYHSEFDPEYTIEANVGGGASICIFIEREQDAASMTIRMNLEEATLIRDNLTKQIAWNRKQNYSKQKDAHPWLAFAKDVQVGEKVKVYNLSEREEDDPWVDLIGTVTERFEGLGDEFFLGIPVFLIQLDSGKKIVSRYIKRVN